MDIKSLCKQYRSGKNLNMFSSGVIKPSKTKLQKAVSASGTLPHLLSIITILLAQSIL